MASLYFLKSPRGSHNTQRSRFMLRGIEGLGGEGDGKDGGRGLDSSILTRLRFSPEKRKDLPISQNCLHPSVVVSIQKHEEEPFSVCLFDGFPPLARPSVPRGYFCWENRISIRCTWYCSNRYAYPILKGRAHKSASSKTEIFLFILPLPPRPPRESKHSSSSLKRDALSSGKGESKRGPSSLLLLLLLSRPLTLHQTTTPLACWYTKQC